MLWLQTKAPGRAPGLIKPVFPHAHSCPAARKMEGRSPGPEGGDRGAGAWSWERRLARAGAQAPPVPRAGRDWGRGTWPCEHFALPWRRVEGWESPALPRVSPGASWGRVRAYQGPFSPQHRATVWEGRGRKCRGWAGSHCHTVSLAFPRTGEPWLVREGWVSLLPSNAWR